MQRQAPGLQVVRLQTDTTYTRVDVIAVMISPRMLVRRAPSKSIGVRKTLRIRRTVSCTTAVLPPALMWGECRQVAGVLERAIGVFNRTTDHVRQNAGDVSA